MEEFDIHTVYTRYKHLNKKQCKEIINALQKHGYAITAISAFYYPEAEAIKHLFFTFAGSKTPVPYYAVDKKLLTLFESILPDIPEE